MTSFLTRSRMVRFAVLIRYFISQLLILRICYWQCPGLVLVAWWASINTEEDHSIHPISKWSFITSKITDQSDVGSKMSWTVRAGNIHFRCRTCRSGFTFLSALSSNKNLCQKRLMMFWGCPWNASFGHLENVYPSTTNNKTVALAACGLACVLHDPPSESGTA
jgi:hypothetical protein